MMWFLMAVAGASSVPAEDRATVERMAAGDEAALAALYDRHGRFVYSLALRIVRDAGDAEDVTQEVFVQAWRQAHRFESARGHVLGWLITLARTRSIDLLRRRRVRPELARDATTPEITDLTPGQDEQLEWGRRAVAVRSALADLPLLQRLVIELAFFDGLSHSEIASQLEVPLGTVKTRVRQGLLKLRDHLAGAAS